MEEVVKLMPVPEFAQRVLDSFDERQDMFTELNVSTDVRKAHPEPSSLSDEEDKTCWAEDTAFRLQHSPAGEKSIVGTHYSPISSGKDKEGNSFMSPNLEQVDGAIINHWQARAQSVTHPLLKARYSDLVWDITHFASGKKPDIQYAWLAIDAYIEVLDRVIEYEHSLAIECWMRRALELSMLTNDQERLVKVVDTILNLAKRLDDKDEPNMCVRVFDLLYDHPKIKLTDPQQGFLIQALEATVDFHSDPGKPENLHPQGAEEPGKRLVKYYLKNNQIDDARRVTRKYGLAYEFLAEKADGFLAVAWLQHIYDAYSQLGMREDAERVQLLGKSKGQEAQQNMKRISVPMDITREEMERFLQAITKGSLEQTLGRLATQFTPSSSEAGDILDRTMKEHPVMGLIGSVILSDDHIAAQTGSIEEDREGRLVAQLAQNIQIEDVFLANAMFKTIEHHSVTAAALTNFVFESPIFADDHKTLVEDGIEAYLKGDHIKAAHVLIPQIEHALRLLLANLGQPTNKIMRSLKGVMQEKNLTDILERESLIKQLLGEDLWRYFRVLLTDPRGFNLRNRISHGLFSAGQFNRFVSERLVHVLLVLAHIREKQDEPEEPT